MFKGKPKVQRTDYGAIVEHGESYGSYGYSFVGKHEGVRSPGVLETDVSLRRVTPPGRADAELQVAIVLTQRYRSGANSRSMHGSLCLRGEALREFCRRVLEEMPVKREPLP